MEDYFRWENFCFYNILENIGESSVECLCKVMDVLLEFGVDLENIMFYVIYWMGNLNNIVFLNSVVSNEVLIELREGVFRFLCLWLILVWFVLRMDSDWVWDNRKKFMGSFCFLFVFIDKDFFVELVR